MPALNDFKCPNCGGAITFDTQSQNLKCPYCDSEIDIDALKQYDTSVKNDRDDKINWNEKDNQYFTDEDSGVRIYICNSCGGEIVADENTAATSCPFCGNPVAMQGNLSGALKPDYVIPFKLDKAEAMEAFKSYLKDKKLLPKVFRSNSKIEEIKGIYVPFWLFDGGADASVRFKGTKLRYWSDSKYNYTETSHYAIYRDGQLDFAHIPVDGSTRMPDDLMESLEPYDFSEAVDFKTAYLSGFMADKYDVSAEDRVGRANERIKFSTEQAMRASVQGYETVSTENSNIDVVNGSAKYALYPVWMMNVTWNGEKYIFAMNGQTGKFVGNLPMDKGAYFKMLLLSSAVGAAFCALIVTIIQLFM